MGRDEYLLPLQFIYNTARHEATCLSTPGRPTTSRECNPPISRVNASRKRSKCLHVQDLKNAPVASSFSDSGMRGMHARSISEKLPQAKKIRDFTSQSECEPAIERERAMSWGDWLAETRRWTRIYRVQKRWVENSWSGWWCQNKRKISKELRS